VSQISDAMSNIDKSTQAAAAQAEENASTVEELHAQSSEMRVHVGELFALIDGVARAAQSESPRPEISSRQITTASKSLVPKNQA